MRCKLGYIQELHRFVEVDIELVKTNPNPKKSKQCIKLKEDLIYLLSEYDKIKKNGVNIKFL